MVDAIHYLVLFVFLFCILTNINHRYVVFGILVGSGVGDLTILYRDRSRRCRSTF